MVRLYGKKSCMVTLGNTKGLVTLCNTEGLVGLSSSLPPLVGGGGGLVCESVGKAELLSDHFDGKQSRESVGLPLICHSSSSLTSFAFRSSDVRRLLLDLDPSGGSDTLGMFPLFFKRTAYVLV